MQEGRPAMQEGRPAILLAGLPAASTKARSRLGEFWLTLGAISVLFMIRFLIRKKWELKYDIP